MKTASLVQSGLCMIVPDAMAEDLRVLEAFSRVNTYGSYGLPSPGMMQIWVPPSPLYKLRPCPSYSRRRDRNNSVHWCSLYKGGG